MISVFEADELLKNNLFSSSKITVDIDHAFGRVLAADLRADRDQPPFNRVTMDGIAIRYIDFESGIRLFRIFKQQFAGEPQERLTDDSGFCIETSTGAVLPENTDTIVPYEWLTANGDGFEVGDFPVLKGKNIHLQGSDVQKNEVVLQAGIRLGSAELGAAVSFGHVEIPVYSHPKVAIVSTGDELVDEHETPLPHQIRRSNTRAIASLLMQHVEVDAYHLIDDPTEMNRHISNLVRDYDVLIFSGGVSKGKRDFLPTILAELGVQTVFHKIRQRPGKPMYFGTSKSAFIFGLPGNPVSAFMCTVRYFMPWLAESTKLKTRPASVVLTTDHHFEPLLTQFIPVRTKVIDGQLVATPIHGNGSGDFTQLIGADGFIELHEESTTFNKGESYPFYAYS